MIVDLPTFTLLHVVISVAAAVAGLVVVGGLVAGARLDGWVALFLVTTILTSVTGFFFPSTKVLPSHVVGVVSLVVLAACLIARYPKRLAGRWRDVFVITAVASTYLNVFVLVVQLFAKTPPLAQLAPTQREAPFAVTQSIVLALFAVIGWAALRAFRLKGAGGRATAGNPVHGHKPESIATPRTS